MSAQAGALSDAGFEMAVSRLVALAGNAHTIVYKKQRASLFGRAPLRFAWFAGGLYVVRTTGPADDLLGRRVVTIDGHPVERALAELRPYLSGTAERARDDSPPLLDCPPLLQAIWPDTDGVHLTVGLENGTVRQFAMLPPAPDPFGLEPIMVIAPGGYGSDWKSVLAEFHCRCASPVASPFPRRWMAAASMSGSMPIGTTSAARSPISWPPLPTASRRVDGIG